MSGAARKAANGVARGANTPLAVEKQSGDRSGDRPLLAVALTREAGLGGEEAKESRAQLCQSDRIRSAPWHVTFRVMCQDPTSNDNHHFVGAFKIFVPSGKRDSPAGVKGPSGS